MGFFSERNVGWQVLKRVLFIAACCCIWQLLYAGRFCVI